MKSYYVALVLVGDTLQRIAQRELNNAERWTELIYINQLRHPYIVSTQAEADANPGTVAYGQAIRIPREQPVATAIPSDEDLFGIDVLLRRRQLDIVDGDIDTISGRPNLVQALEHRLDTDLGELLRHADYGCNLRAVLGEKHSATMHLLAIGFVRRALNAEPRVRSISRLEAISTGDILTLEATVVPVIDNTPVDLNLVFPIEA